MTRDQLIAELEWARTQAESDSKWLEEKYGYGRTDDPRDTFNSRRARVTTAINEAITFIKSAGDREVSEECVHQWARRRNGRTCANCGKVEHGDFG